LRSRFGDEEMDFPIEGQCGAAGFAPKILLDRACGIAFEHPPKWSDLVKLTESMRRRTPVLIFAVTGARADGNSGWALGCDPVMAN
jgi:hypothetical protein